MKKRIAAILCAAMLMLALPTLAFAADSPSNTQTATSDSGITGTVTFTGTADIKAVSAGNVTVSGAEVALAAFEITTNDTVDADHPIKLTFTVDKKYAGCTGRVHVVHADGSAEDMPITIGSDGTATIKITKLSTFTLVVDPTTASATANKSATSPVTGLDVAGVAGVTAVAAIAAGCVFVALRKKTNE